MVFYSFFSLQDFVKEVKKGNPIKTGDVYLIKDIILTNGLMIDELSKGIEINGNGHTLTVPEGADFVCFNVYPGDLDEGGKEFTSVGFSQWLQQRMNTVSRRLVFVIGGPYGFSPEVYALAQGKISLSQMTFSHQMVRVIFAEQFYRALSILNNLPYHHI